MQQSSNDINKDSYFDRDELAKRLGVDVQTVIRLENGELAPNPEQLKIILSFVNECGEQVKAEIKDDIDMLLKKADVHLKAATESITQSNSFEFKVCDLILRATAGAFFLYLIALGLKQGQSPRIEPLILWGGSLFIGVWHQITWANRLHTQAEVHNRISARLLTDLTLRKENPKKLRNKLFAEEQHFHETKDKNKKIFQKDYEYVAVPRSYGKKAIWFQIFLLVLGAVWALWGITHFSLDLDQLGVLVR